MNHRVTHWVHFLGFEDSGSGADDATRIIPFTITPFSHELLKKYCYYQQLAQTFDPGALFRDSESALDGDMTHTYGQKTHLIAATARNPDGTWSVGIQNFTADSFSGAQGQADDTRVNAGVGTVPMTNGSRTISVAPLELVTLRTSRAIP